TGKPCTIFGDGGKTRDYVYVDDVVDAFVRAAEKGSGLLLNVGTGRETADQRLYDTMAAAAGVTDPPLYAPDRAGDLQRNCLDAARAATYLGWKPWTSLEDGTAEVIDWFRRNGDRLN